MSYQETIERCSALLENSRTAAAIGKLKMDAPMLNVFMGEEALRYRETVESVCMRAWGTAAGTIQYLAGDEVTRGKIYQSAFTALAGRGFRNLSKINIFYYWDIDDEGFEHWLEEISNVKAMPTGITESTFFYIFFRQTAGDETQALQDRIRELEALAQEHGGHFILMSDVTDNGFLLGSRMEENYRAAADISVMVESYVNGKRPSSLGFDLQSTPFATFCYYSQGKDTTGIARAALASLVRNYRDLVRSGANPGRTGTGAGRFEPAAVMEFFDGLFKKYIAALIPQSSGFLFYLPWDEAVSNYDRLLREPAAGGLFRKKDGNRNTLEAANAAAREAAPFLTAIEEKYFAAPAEYWLGNGGREKIRQDIMSFLIRNNYSAGSVTEEEITQMRSAESEQIRRKMALSPDVPSAADWFYRLLVRDLRAQLYTDFYYITAEEIGNLADKAPGFSRVLDQAVRNLTAEDVDPSIVSVYDKVISSFFDEHREQLRGRIRPCDDTESFLAQTEDLFRNITEKISAFSLPMIEELEWRVRAAGKTVDARAVIENCFSYDIRNAARVRTFSVPGAGKNYSIISSTGLLDSLEPDMAGAAGESFEVPQSNYIERFCIYELDPEQIIW